MSAADEPIRSGKTMIAIRGDRFVDEQGRTLMLRGLNVGGSSKVPALPDGDTRFAESLEDPSAISFVGRPFPLEEADEHVDHRRVGHRRARP